MKFAAIANWAAQGEFDVAFMCHHLEVSRSGYYAWRGGQPSAREERDAQLSALIEAAYARLRGNPGVRRMRAELAACGHPVSHKRVWRLMRDAGLRGRHPRAWRRTTIRGDEDSASAPDLIGRDFTAQAPNERWCGDITYIKCWTGWAYLATVIDLHSRAVVGWAIEAHMRTSLVTDALDMAIRDRRPGPNLVFHSDKGTQYTSGEFERFCRKNKIVRSLGKTGICFDNAVAESFFATYKKELIHTHPWPDIHRLREQTNDWIVNYYNTNRRLSLIHI